MKLLFWNLFRKENSRYIHAILKDHRIDIAIFCEHQNTFFDHRRMDRDGYTIEHGLGANEKLIALFRKSMKYDVNREVFRYTLYSFTLNDEPIIIAGVHLEDRRNHKEGSRLITLEHLAQDINELERRLGSRKTVVIGDFNSNPFEAGMIHKRGLNAVLFKSLIQRKEVVRYEGKDYRRFYNPMMLTLSEENKEYGSCYYSANEESLYWNTLDQVVVRKELMDKLVKVEFLKEVGDRSLLTKSGIPSKRISDHLPLIVEVSL